MNDADDVENLILALKARSDHIKQEDMDDVSWGMEEGVLISGTEANFIIKLLENIINGKI